MQSLPIKQQHTHDDNSNEIGVFDAGWLSRADKSANEKMIWGWNMNGTKVSGPALPVPLHEMLVEWTGHCWFTLTSAWKGAHLLFLGQQVSRRKGHLQFEIVRLFSFVFVIRSSNDGRSRYRKMVNEDDAEIALNSAGAFNAMAGHFHPRSKVEVKLKWFVIESTQRVTNRNKENAMQFDQEN